MLPKFPAAAFIQPGSIIMELNMRQLLQTQRFEIMRQGTARRIYAEDLSLLYVDADSGFDKTGRRRATI
jgi:hypothetical protein